MAVTSSALPAAQPGTEAQGHRYLRSVPVTVSRSSVLTMALWASMVSEPDPVNGGRETHTYSLSVWPSVARTPIVRASLRVRRRPSPSPAVPFPAGYRRNIEYKFIGRKRTGFCNAKQTAYLPALRRRSRKRLSIWFVMPCRPHRSD